MAKKTIDEIIAETARISTDKEITLIKEWQNPEGGLTFPIGHKLEVDPELYAIMESQGVIETKKTLNKD